MFCYLENIRQVHSIMECSIGTHLVDGKCEPVGMHPLLLGIFVPLGVVVVAIAVWAICLARLPKYEFDEEIPEENVRSESELE